MAVVADTAAPPAARPLTRARLAASLRIGVAVLGLAVLARTVGGASLLRIVAHADPRLLLAAALLGTLAQASAVLPWRLLLPADDRLRWPHLTAVYLRATFAGQVLPTGLGGDAVRAVETGRVVGRGPAVAAVAVSRFLGVAAMAVWALAASAALGDRDGAAVPAVAAGLLVAVAALAAVTLWSARAARGREAVTGSRRRVLADVLHHLHAYVLRPRVLLAALAASVAGWGLTLAAMVVFGRALGAEVDWDVLAGALPLSLAVTLLPVTVNGLGVREGVLVAMLGITGVGASTAAALAAFADLQALPLALAGAALWAARRRTGAVARDGVIQPKETPGYGASAPAVAGEAPLSGPRSPWVAPGDGRLSRGGLLPVAATEPTMNHPSTTKPVTVRGARTRR